jgi:hypothetical protein
MMQSDLGAELVEEFDREALLQIARAADRAAFLLEAHGGGLQLQDRKRFKALSEALYELR